MDRWTSVLKTAIVRVVVHLAVRGCGIELIFNLLPQHIHIVGLCTGILVEHHLDASHDGQTLTQGVAGGVLLVLDGTLVAHLHVFDALVQQRHLVTGSVELAMGELELALQTLAVNISGEVGHVVAEFGERTSCVEQVVSENETVMWLAGIYSSRGGASRHPIHINQSDWIIIITKNIPITLVPEHPSLIINQ